MAATAAVDTHPTGIHSYVILIFDTIPDKAMINSDNLIRRLFQRGVMRFLVTTMLYAATKTKQNKKQPSIFASLSFRQSHYIRVSPIWVKNKCKKFLRKT